ncbi:MAG: heavy-metal-associated domain-containing protein [Desulforhopalus sp.]
MDTLKIKGMSCQHCVSSVKKALEEINGISEVTVDLKKATAIFKNNGAAEKDIKAAISKIGFEPLD